MTEIDARQFIKNVMQGLWLSWKPSDILLELWVSKLRNYDYFKAEREIKNWICETDYVAKAPAIGKILKYFNAKKVGTFVEQREEFVEEPGKLYGKEARDKAFADILNGPDNKTRRWLVKYLEKQYPEKKGAVKIGEAIRI